MILVTNLHDSTSKRKERKREERPESQGFEGILKQACAEVGRKENTKITSNQDISYTASGYTRNGMAFDYLEKRREYIQ